MIFLKTNIIYANFTYLYRKISKIFLYNYKLLKQRMWTLAKRYFDFYRFILKIMAILCIEEVFLLDNGNELISGSA